MFFSINNITISNCEPVLEIFNLLTVEQLGLYFKYKTHIPASNINSIIPSFSIINICKGLKLYKIEIYS